MVKSPWRLLTGLLSWGKPADQHEVGQPGFTERLEETEVPGANSFDAEPSRESEPTPEPRSSAPLQAGDDYAGDRQEPTPSMMAEVLGATVTDETTVPATDRDVIIAGAGRRNQQGKARPTTRRKARAEISIHTEEVGRANGLTERSAADEPDPVRALDSEIRELRAQLAGKLRLQNDQLRQMLRRFEPK